MGYDYLTDRTLLSDSDQNYAGAEHSPNPIEEDSKYYLMFGVILLCCSFLGVIGNSISLKYFHSHSKSATSLTYMFISLFDLAASIMLVPIGLSCLNRRKGLYFKNKIFCSTWSIMWNINVRMNVLSIGG